MALYEPIPLPEEKQRTYKYRVEISIDPITGLRRFLDVECLLIAGFSIALPCWVSYADAEGNDIITERIKPYPHTLYASKEGPFVDMQGNRVEAEFDSEGNLPEGVTTRYAFLMQLFNQPILHPQGLLGYELMFIENADVTLKEFDK